MVADIEELETMDAFEKTQCKRGDISKRKWKILFFQSEMDESNFLEEIRT